MGLMDLSTSATSKKHVDFNDARYQLSDKLKQNTNKNIRSTFTLYDSKDFDKVAVQDISAAYALSDKKLSLGELMNKMVDLIIDMEDGILDTEKDAVYAWKYSMTILQIYDDKRKRQESLNSFDNGLKNAVVNSKTFIERYPGKYTARTNFFDVKTKNELIENIVATFKDAALPKIHDSAIAQSKKIAEKHSNPILDRIVKWAIENYRCTADSFFAVTEDQETGLFFSVNTIILHLRNGYDMSIVGHVGTDRDDQFAISILNANDISIQKHGERINQGDVESALSEASNSDPIDPLSKLLAMEKKKNAVLMEQYQILTGIRPMIPAHVLDLKAAESVVGQDYIWGCRQWREKHEDLPADFSLDDVVLPVFEEDNPEFVQQQTLANEINQFTNNVDDFTQDVDTKQIEAATVEVETSMPELVAPVHDDAPVNEPAQVTPPAPAEEPQDALFSLPSDLFETKKPAAQQEKKFGESTSSFHMPRLNLAQAAPKATTKPSEPKKQSSFDVTSTMLPGVTPVKKKVVVDDTPSITQQAKPMPTPDNAPQWKQPETTPVVPTAVEKKQPVKEEEVSTPELILDDIDSLFDT